MHVKLDYFLQILFAVRLKYYFVYGSLVFARGHIHPIENPDKFYCEY
jgi:hypothetical protein